MKRVLLLLFLTCSLVGIAQTKHVRVTTRLGSVYEGVLKELKAFEHVILVVDGRNILIPFEEMAYIDEIKPEKAQAEAVAQAEIVPEPEPIAVKAEVVPVPVPVEVAPETEPVEAVPEPVDAPVPVEVPAPVEVQDKKWSSYKGFLLSAGNRVYMNCTSEPTMAAYDAAAVDVLRRQLERDRFWTMVDTPAEAHFTINYTLNPQGNGKLVLSISSDYVDEPEILGNAKMPEDTDEYRKIVYDLYQKFILPLQKKIEKDSLPKHTRKLFTVE